MAKIDELIRRTCLAVGERFFIRVVGQPVIKFLAIDSSVRIEWFYILSVNPLDLISVDEEFVINCSDVNL